MDNLNVCIVGAGSSYTPELLHGFLALPEGRLPVGRLTLTDVDPRRLEIMAGLARRMAAHKRANIAIAADTRLEPMLDGANFVITQIRVGGMKARHIDESIPVKYGVIGQETTGPGGMCKALRTIPPMLAIARAVERFCPEAFILNYTNPSGIITEAVTKHTRARIVGLCSGMPGIQRDIARRLAGRFPDLRTFTVGLNHFGFVHRFLAAGRDVTAEAIELLAASVPDSDDNARMDMQLARLLQAVPISYVNYYWRRGQKLAALQAAPQTRAQQVEEIERQVLAEAASSDAHERPAALQGRGGGGYSDITFSVMRAIAADTGEEFTASAPNRGCVEGVEDDAVVELLCRVDARGATPLPVGAIPAAFRGFMLAIKAYESLTVEAAVTGSRRLATLALMNHPLVGDLDIIEPMLDEMLAAHGLELR